MPCIFLMGKHAWTNSRRELGVFKDLEFISIGQYEEFEELERVLLYAETPVKFRVLQET